MKKSILFIFTFCLLSLIGSAQQIEVGKVNNGVFELSENSEQLVKAIEWTFRDGTKVVELKIEQLQNAYFLVATCTYQNRKRLAAIDLDMEGNSFVVKEDAFFKTCSAVACETCRYFLENNKIVACKCEETGSISNHCHYKSSPATSFITNYYRALKLKQDK
ncbi:MAG: hypothetical protein ACOVP1_09340 [Bacteroidia bacterium]